MYLNVQGSSIVIIISEFDFLRPADYSNMSFLESKSSALNQSAPTLLNTSVNEADYESVYYVLHDDEEEKNS